MTSDKMIEVMLTDGNRGDHEIKINGRSYGSRVDGERFLIQEDHAALFPHRFHVLGAPAQQPSKQMPTPKKVAQPAAPRPPAPTVATPAAEPIDEDVEPRIMSGTEAADILGDKLNQLNTVDAAMKGEEVAAVAEEKPKPTPKRGRGRPRGSTKKNTTTTKKS